MYVRLPFAVLSLAAALMLSGCGRQTDGNASAVVGAGVPTSSTSTSTSDPRTPSAAPTSSKSPTPDTAESSTAATASTPASTPESADAKADGDVQEATFGDTFAWHDGLSVSIAAPTAFTPSEYAAADPAATYVSFSITIINGTGKTYDPSSFFVSVISGTAESGSVYDSDNDLNGPPSTGILDGRNATFTAGFGVADAGDLVLEVSPGYDYTDVYFTSTGKMATAGNGPGSTGTVIKETDSDRARFGETYEWTNGLQVSVSAPTPFTPGEYAAAEAAAAYLSFTVTVVNNTGGLYDPSLLFTSVQSGSRDGDQVFDSANGFNGSPGTGLLNGRTLTFVLGYGVSDPADTVLEVTPGFDYEAAYFTTG